MLSIPRPVSLLCDAAREVVALGGAPKRQRCEPRGQPDLTNQVRVTEIMATLTETPTGERQRTPGGLFLFRATNYSVRISIPQQRQSRG